MVLIEETANSNSEPQQSPPPQSSSSQNSTNRPNLVVSLPVNILND